MDAPLKLSFLSDELSDVHHQLWQQYQAVNSTLIPFDKIYDEDHLEAKRYQACIIKEEIHRLELELETMTAVSNAMVQRSKDKLELFNDKLDTLCSEIDILEAARDRQHQSWKEGYMKALEKLVHLDKHIKSIERVQHLLEVAQKKDLKFSKNVMLLCSLQSEVNNLLQLKQLRKERLPHNAFRVAYNHGLVSKDAYTLMMT